MLRSCFKLNNGPSSSLVQCRRYTTEARVLQRSWLYVPTSSDKMLAKSLVSDSDMIIYDLEDSVSPSDKENARQRLFYFLQQAETPPPERIAVRINDITSPFFQEDVAQILRSLLVRTLVLPKIHSALDLHHVSRALHAVSQTFPRETPVHIVPSIESARGLWNIGDIAQWKSEYGPRSGGKITDLLFAAEDYCADTSIIRSASRQELLYTRSRILVAARAFGLGAIDMVSSS